MSETIVHDLMIEEYRQQDVVSSRDRDIGLRHSSLTSRHSSVRP